MTTPAIPALTEAAGQLAAAVQAWHDGAHAAAAAAAPPPPAPPPPPPAAGQGG